jgi:hypothetical protein
MATRRPKSKLDSLQSVLRAITKFFEEHGYDADVDIAKAHIMKARDREVSRRMGKGGGQ